jgi:cytochrome c
LDRRSRILGVCWVGALRGECRTGVPTHFLFELFFEIDMRTLILLTSGLLFASGAAHAVDEAAAIELAKNNGCLSCHSAKEKIVGPSYSAVHEKYKDDKDAVASLVQSIQNGSKGKWGRIPMPAHPSMSPADIKTLAEWVMTIKP